MTPASSLSAFLLLDDEDVIVRRFFDGVERRDEDGDVVLFFTEVFFLTIRLRFDVEDCTLGSRGAD